MDDIDKLSESEREKLRIALNLLFTESFLVRSVEHHAASYRFVVSNFRLVEDYLAVAGWGLKKDEVLGVVAFQGPPSARLGLSKDESILLLILRLLFEERAGELTLHGERTVRQHEIVDKQRVFTDVTWRKTRYLGMLRRFQVLRLIRVVGDESDPEALVVLYPSIAFALDGIALDEAVSRISEASEASEASENGGVPADQTASQGDDECSS